MASLLYLVVSISAFKSFKINVYTLCTVDVFVGYSTQFMLARQWSPSLKCKVALIIPGGYCSCVALHSRPVWSLGTFRRNNRISISPPWQRKDGTPSCQVWPEVGKKEGWLIPVTYISVVLITSLLAVT